MLVVGASCLASAPAVALAPPVAEVAFLAVGYGDAAVYRGPCGEVGIVDVAAGAEDEVLAQLDAWQARTAVKWMVVSNYRDEHVGGVEAVATAVGVAPQAIHDRGGPRGAYDSATYHRYHDWVTASGLRQPLDTGDRLELCGDDAALRFTVVSAGTDGTAIAGVAVDDERDRGLCMKAEYGWFDLATCGDAGGEQTAVRADVETAVAASMWEVEVVKVSDHGAATASNQHYVDTLRPQFAIISTGTNTEGAPDPDVIERWRSTGAVLITNDPNTGDEDSGKIEIATNGNEFEVRTNQPPREPTFRLTSEGASVIDRSKRLRGDDRISTAAAVVRDAFAESDEVVAVVLARADDYADALAGAPLAGALGGPILLTGTDRLASAARLEIQRLGASQAFVLGGAAAVSERVVTDLADIGVEVTRIAGDERFDTARRIALELSVPAGSPDAAYVVEGTDPDPHRGWPDAIAVSSLAAQTGRPILGVTTDALPPATRQAFDQLELRSATVVGGALAVSDHVRDELASIGVSTDRLSGPTRYDTSRAVADAAAPPGRSVRVWFVTGDDYPDGLAAGAAAATHAGVVLLVDGDDLDRSAATRDWVAARACDIAGVRFVGGTHAISDPVAEELGRLSRPAAGTCGGA